MKKILVIILSILISVSTFANNIKESKEINPLNMNTKYLDKLKTENVVFDEVYKDFIKSYNENFIELDLKIKNNNNKVDISIRPIYLKANEALKNHKYSGTGDYIKERINSLSPYSYDLKRVSKLKFESQEKEIDNFLNDQIKNYGSILKKILNQYDIDTEEKKLISLLSKEIVQVFKDSAKENEGYSVRMLGELNKNITSYERFQDNYEYELKEMNNKIDRKIFKIIWPHVRSKVKSV